MKYATTTKADIKSQSDQTGIETFSSASTRNHKAWSQSDQTGIETVQGHILHLAQVNHNQTKLELKLNE